MPSPTVRWEMLREGIEDYDYLALLADRTAKAKSSGKNPPAVKAAEALLSEARSIDGSTIPAMRANVAAAIEDLK